MDNVQKLTSVSILEYTWKPVNVLIYAALSRDITWQKMGLFVLFSPSLEDVMLEKQKVMIPHQSLCEDNTCLLFALSSISCETCFTNNAENLESRTNQNTLCFSVCVLLRIVWFERIGRDAACGQEAENSESSWVYVVFQCVFVCVGFVLHVSQRK